MKAVLLFALLFPAAALQAQETPGSSSLLQKQIQAYANKKIDTLFKEIIPNTVRIPGNRVVTLPQDGMPCIVPDTRSVALMPNAWSRPTEPVAGQIPNPARKHKKGFIK